MFTLIEINGDHLSDLERTTPEVGEAIAAIVRNTYNAPRVLEEFDLYRAIRVVGQSGERYETRAEFNVREDERVESVLRTDGVKINPPPETPMLYALQINNLTKDVSILTRQMQSISNRVDEVARRVSALEQWRKA
jgi:hypothetical protein